MDERHDVELTRYSTMRLKAVGQTVYEPGNVTELRDLIFAMHGMECHLPGAGSNVVFAERVKTPIVSLMKLNDTVEDLGGGRFRAGCSVRIQRLIRFAQQFGFGGIEYLFSLPASLGGCVYMNAGRGRGTGDAIANVLEEVELMDFVSGAIRREPVNRSEFGHRRSPYQDQRCVFLGAILRLSPQSPDETEGKIQERLETSRKWLNADIPSCGSVFKRGNKFVFRAFRWLHPRSGALAFSRKTPRGLGRHVNGTLSDFKDLVGELHLSHPKTL